MITMQLIAVDISQTSQSDAWGLVYGYSVKADDMAESKNFIK